MNRCSRLQPRAKNGFHMLMAYNKRDSIWPQSLNYLLSSPLQKTFADPVTEWYEEDDNPFSHIILENQLGLTHANL